MADCTLSDKGDNVFFLSHGHLFWGETTLSEQLPHGIIICFFLNTQPCRAKVKAAVYKSTMTLSQTLQLTCYLLAPMLWIGYDVKLVYLPSSLVNMAPMLVPLKCGFHFQKRKLAHLFRRTSSAKIWNKGDGGIWTDHKRRNTHLVSEGSAGWRGRGVFGMTASRQGQNRESNKLSRKFD